MDDALYDVAVAGGGPAGSTLAARLAQRGRRVVLFEREAFPRFHLGESLLPRSLDVLDKMGVLPRFEDRLLRKYGARFVEATSGIEAAFTFRDSLPVGVAQASEDSSLSRPYAFQGARAEIDHIMLDRAGELGAEVHLSADVERVRSSAVPGEPGELTVRTVHGERRVRARVIVDATGRSHFLSRGKGATTKIPMLERTLAVFAHFDGCARLAGESEGDIRIVIAKEGWFWIIPFRGDRTSVGLVIPARALEASSAEAARADVSRFFADACDRYDVIREILKGSTRAIPVGTAADFSYGVTRIHGPGWLTVGDAAGFIDPLFSTGFHLAVCGADLAAAAIDDVLESGEDSKPRFEIYERAVRRASTTFIGVVQAFYDGPLVPLLFDAQKKPLLKRMITSVLAGDVFHEGDEPRWLSEVRRLFPPRLATGDVPPNPTSGPDS